MKNFRVDLNNVAGTSGKGSPLPRSLQIEYQEEAVDDLVRRLTQLVNEMGSLDIQTTFSLNQFLVGLYKKSDDETEPKKLNLNDWSSRSVLTLYIHPNGEFGIVMESTSPDKTTTGVYAPIGPLRPSEKSRIVYPH